MKVETSKTPPAFNVQKPEEISEQNSQIITKVIMTNGSIFDITPGTFHYYKTPGDRPVPFIRFEHVDGFTIECFPASIAGWAYVTPSSEEDDNKE